MYFHFCVLCCSQNVSTLIKNLNQNLNFRFGVNAKYDIDEELIYCCSENICNGLFSEDVSFTPYEGPTEIPFEPIGLRFDSAEDTKSKMATHQISFQLFILCMFLR